MEEHAFISQLIEDLGLDSVQIVLNVFDEDLDDLTGRIADAAAAGDLDAFCRAAHGLAGAAGAVGAATLEQACRTAMTVPDADHANLVAMSAEITALGTAARRLFRAMLADFARQDASAHRMGDG